MWMCISRPHLRYCLLEKCVFELKIFTNKKTNRFERMSAEYIISCVNYRVIIMDLNVGICN